jgi:ferredoxin
MTRKLLLCDCAGSQRLDRHGIATATGLECPAVATGLCTHQIDRVAAALAGPDDVVVACRQEAETFATLAEELGVAEPACVDIRDRAGWSDEGGRATPKIAALLALPEAPPARVIDIVSEGLALVHGAADVSLPLAERLADALSVTCLLTDAADILPGRERRFDVARGRLRTARGSFGRFEVTVDAYRAADPAGRGPLSFAAPQDAVRSECDVIVDVSGGTPLFSAHHKRDGYLRADPRDPAAVMALAVDAVQLVGTFEKTLHVRLEEHLCAHSRAGQIGCTRCLDVCPTGAIVADGDHVAVDTGVCAGCGACSAVCPSQAIALDAPPVGHVMGQIRALAAAYLAAGGTTPRLLVHDDHGREMIAMAARLGRGLPADVLPLEVPAIAAFGHAEMLAALACGFAEVSVLPAPRSEREVLERELALARALADGTDAGAHRLRLVDTPDPDVMTDALYTARPGGLGIEPILPLGRRRDVARLAVRALTPRRDAIPLPDGAPYGAVLVDAEACTLCLSCAGLCPSGALGDDPDRPMLTFTEDACLQCGLCATICPEDAITLEPRLDPSDAALSPRVMKEEEPYACIECGRLFGVKSTVERIVAKLEGHALFTNSDNARLIRMCDDCRVQAQYHADAAPFRGAPRPRPRTTDDYKT